jgi:outer membrane protein TolC
VVQAYLRAKTALVQHDLFGDTHVPHAEQALRVTEAAYVADDGDLTALLDALRGVERVHLEHVQAGAEFEKSFAELERAVGGPVDRPRPSGARRHRHD